MKENSRTVVERATDDFLCHLRERNASPHTIKAYTTDLDAFAAFVGSRTWKEIDHITIRGFLSHLYDKGLSKTSVARALAAVRSLYRWLAQEGVVEQNPAKLVSTPRLAKKLPRVPTIEEMNTVLDAKMPEVAAFPERDRLLLELLYGCGIRNSELVGINLDDISLSNEAILIRGKGKKERYAIPFGGSALAALSIYLPLAPGSYSPHTKKHIQEVRFARKSNFRAPDQPAWRTPHHPQRRPHSQAHRGSPGTIARRSSPHSASRLRHSHAGRRSGPASHTGVTRPRAPGHDPALHSALRQARNERLRSNSSPSEMSHIGNVIFLGHSLQRCCQCLRIRRFPGLYINQPRPRFSTFNYPTASPSAKSSVTWSRPPHLSP